MSMPPSWIASGVGLMGSVMFFFLWLEAREDLAAQVEVCNREKLEAVVEAESLARRAERAAAERSILIANQLKEEAEQAVQDAQRAVDDAMARPPEVREVIRRVTVTENCLSQPVPADILDSLRDN